MKKLIVQIGLGNLMLLWGTAICSAQAAVPATQEVGLLSYGSYHGDDVDKVDLKSGNLFARIPLFSLPQLGKLSLSMSMTLNDNGFAVADTCDTFEISVQSGDNQNDVDETDCWPYVYRQLPVGPTLTLDQDLGIYFSDSPPVYWGYNVTDSPTSTIIDATGASHLMGYDMAFGQTQVQHATDGTGYTFVPTSPTQFTQGSIHTGAGLLYTSTNGVRTIADPALASNGLGAPIRYGLIGGGTPDLSFMFNTEVGDPELGTSSPGYSYSGCAVGAELETYCDGGEVNFTSPGPIVDSVGRAIPDLAASPLLTDANDLTACPNLNISNQTPMGIQLWQVPGPNGQTSTYKICYTTVSYSTNFLGGWGFQDASNADFYTEYYMDAMGSGPAIQSIVLPNGTYWGFVYDSIGQPSYIPGTSLLNPCSSYASSGDFCGTPSPVAYGDVTKIIRPSGGITSYTYASTSASLACGYSTYSNEGGAFANPVVGRMVQNRTVSDGLGASSTWGYSWSISESQGLVTTITDPVIPNQNGTKTIHTYKDSVSGECSLPERLVQTFDGNTIVKSISTQYLTVLAPDGVLGHPAYEELPQAMQTFVGTQSGLMLTDTTSYSYAPLYANTSAMLTTAPEPQVGTIANATIYYEEPIAQTVTGADGTVRSDLTTFEWQLLPSSSLLSFASPSVNILDAPALKCTLGTAPSSPATGCQPVLSISASATQSVYGDSSSPYNLAAVQQLLGGNWLTTKTIQHDQWGRVTSTQDAKGNPTTFAYGDDPIWGGPSPFPNQSWDALASTIGYSDQFTYDDANGNILTHIDRNGGHTTYIYDSMGRALSVHYPDQGLTTYCYSDDTNGSCHGSVPFTVYKTEAASPDPPITSSVAYDGLVRRIHSVGSDGAVTNSVYDALGRRALVTNPYFSTSDSTYGSTLFSYDALNRKVVERHVPDSNTVQWCYNGLATQGQTNCLNKESNSGLSWIDVSDESNVHSQQVSDGLGNLVAVMTGTNPALETDYGYDPLGDLTAVNQNGIFSESPRTRSFTYDSLSRLLTSYNPETGTICYGQWSGGSVGSGTCQNGYDANGNLLYKTDANNMMISYTYDVLNRLTSKTAPDGGSTAESFYYDQCISGYPCGNPIGRLTLEGNYTQGGQLFAYDSMGRVTNTDWFNWNTQSWQSGMGVLYDLAGNAIQLTYPDGRVVSQSWDGAGRLATVNDGALNSGGAPYISALQYYPSGFVSASTYGNGVSLNTSLNNRLQPCHEMATSSLLPSTTSGGNLLERQLFYGSTVETNCGAAVGNNGNIHNVLEGVGDTMSQSFSYDSLNRLTGAYSVNRPAVSTYNQTYNYDSFGNMLPVDNLHTPMNYGIDAATNRTTLNGTLQTGDLQYYPNGALHQSPAALGGYLYYWYTAQGYLRGIGTNSASDNFNPGSYLYDALGERTLAYHNNQTWNEYVYLNGQPLADLDNTGTWTDYIYANGQKIAMAASQKPLWHMHGIRNGVTDVGCGTIWTVGSLASNINGVQIQDGDQWVYDLNQQDAYSGLGILFQDGTGTGSVLDENTGNALVDNPTPAGWAHMMADLSPFAGEVMSYAVGGAQPSPYIGSWDIWIANMAIVHADGTVLPLFSGQPIGGSLWGSCGEQGLSFETDPTPTSDRNVSTNYYLADQVGTTQMELAPGGWPMWQGAFTPFGQEIVNGGEQNLIGQQTADGTNDRYKFTGKERDTESGLDYFGARYYASNMGRFMSPDWAEKAQAVPYADLMNPQSLNLYAYVGNNPLSRVDADGHFWPQWHFLITYAAAVAVGTGPFHGVFSAFGKAWKTMAVDWLKGSQGLDAQHANWHDTAGQKPDGSGLQTRSEANAASSAVIDSNLQTDPALAGHDAEDSAAWGHGGKPWNGMHFDLETLEHEFTDNFPSPSRIKDAYEKEKDVLRGINPLQPNPSPNPTPMPTPPPNLQPPQCIGCFNPKDLQSKDHN